VCLTEWLLFSKCVPCYFSYLIFLYLFIPDAKSVFEVNYDIKLPSQKLCPFIFLLILTSAGDWVGRGGAGSRTVCYYMYRLYRYPCILLTSEPHSVTFKHFLLVQLFGSFCGHTHSWLTAHSAVLATKSTQQPAVSLLESNGFSRLVRRIFFLPAPLYPILATMRGQWPPMVWKAGVRFLVKTFFLFSTGLLCNFLVQGLFWKVDSCSAYQEIVRFYEIRISNTVFRGA
jgi:hypothetical protein